jgi:hypothetical protein
MCLCVYTLDHVRVHARVCARVHTFLPHTRCSGVHGAVLERALLKQA